MFSRLIRGLAPLSLLFATAAAAQADAPVTSADLRRHIDMLASDAFEGRAPGTAGERRTIDYIAEQWRARGLEPAGTDGGWFQRVPLVERAPQSHETRWTAGERTLAFDSGDLVLVGRDESASVADAPVVFAGHGARMPDRGVDQIAGTDVRGAVVLILVQGPDIPGFPSLAQRALAMSEAGAAAVLTIVDDGIWPQARAFSARPVTRLEGTPVPPLTGIVSLAAVQRLIAEAGGDFERILDAQPGSSFRAVTLPLRVSIEATTQMRRFTSNNVVGRIRGSGQTGESVLFLGHWDHFGLCRPQGEADRICNGAVDNASGIAALIEIAGRLARGPRPVRDILLLATTAEEIGLRGAEYFAANPAVSLSSIVAAVNLDTIAIHPAGEPVAVIGRGDAALDAAVDATIAAMGRRLDSDDEAAEFVTRQDGWALARAGVPAVMVGGSFSNMALLNAFLSGSYHKPDDEPGPGLMLDGAAEDSTLQVALGRRLADPAAYSRPDGDER